MLPRCQFRLGYRVFRVRRLRGVSLSVVLTIAKNPGSILTIVGRSEPFWVSCERRAVGGNPVARENGAALLKIICGMKQPEIAEPTHHWPAEQIEHWPIERLKLYANNPRLHTEADLGKIAACFQMFRPHHRQPVSPDRLVDFFCRVPALRRHLQDIACVTIPPDRT